MKSFLNAFTIIDGCYEAPRYWNAHMERDKGMLLKLGLIDSVHMIKHLTQLAEELISGVTLRHVYRSNG